MENLISNRLNTIKLKNFEYAMSIKSLNKMRICAAVLLLFAGLNALAAGYSFIIDPSDRGLGMTTEYLRYSSFNNYLVPGIILFIAIGVLSIITAVITLKQYHSYQIFIINQGSILTGWIIIQVILVRDFNWMHLTCILIGLILIFFGIRLRNEAPTAKIFPSTK